jgi:hypothetical protein
LGYGVYFPLVGVPAYSNILSREEIAEKDFNSKLGIVGGISLLSTTGIVESMSQKVLKKLLALKLSVIRISSGPSRKRQFKKVFLSSNYFL